MNNPFVPSSALIARNGINRRIVRGPKRSQRLVSKSPYTRRPLQKRVIQCFDALSLFSLSLSVSRIHFVRTSLCTKRKREVPRLVLVHVTEYNWPYTKPLLANFQPSPLFQRRLKNFDRAHPFPPRRFHRRFNLRNEFLMAATTAHARKSGVARNCLEPYVSFYVPTPRVSPIPCKSFPEPTNFRPPRFIVESPRLTNSPSPSTAVFHRSS